MKYDDIEVSDSYNYEANNITRDKIGKKRKFNILDIAVVGSVCGVLISTTILLSRLMSNGMMNAMGVIF